MVTSASSYRAGGEEEKVVIGCKVSIKDSANVQVFLDLERQEMNCVANGKVQEKFDLTKNVSFWIISR